MKDDVRLELTTNKKLKIDCLVFDTVYGDSDGLVIPHLCDYTRDNDHIILADIRCYSAKLKRSISFNKIKFNNYIKLTVYSTDIKDKPVNFDNVKSISIMLYTGNTWIGSRQIDINNIQKINDDTCDDEIADIEDLKVKIINYKEEVEKLKLEVESLKDIVNAGRTSMDELGTKLDKAISNYKSSTRVYK